MKQLPNVLESKAKIRFQDCDPFNHLNNAAYINYLINAREDQLIEFYDVDIYRMATTLGKSWVVGTNQIAYIKPALLMEEVTIDSQLLQYDASNLLVELRMWNHDKTQIKAVMWSTFIHFNLVQQEKEAHSEELMKLFENVVNPVDTTTFEKRINEFRKQKV